MLSKEMPSTAAATRSARRAGAVRRLPLVLAALAALATLLAACGSSSTTTTTSPPASSSTTSTSTSTSSSSTSSAVSVHAQALPVVGAALVDSAGRTLYIFEPDDHSKVTCVGACTAVWPPLKLSSGQTATATGQAKASLLGSDADPEGGRVVTYDGWPLYTYVGDAVGHASGQGLNTNGGVWYVISPAGTVITKAP